MKKVKVKMDFNFGELISSLIFPCLVLAIVVIIIGTNPTVVAIGKERYVYMSAVDKWINDNQSIYYANKCNSSDGSGQAVCVMKETQSVYRFINDSGKHKLRSPSEYVELGGVCKDSAIFYGTIFKRLGWNINFRFPIPNHVTLTISKKTCNSADGCWVYCDVEANMATCYNVKRGNYG